MFESSTKYYLKLIHHNITGPAQNGILGWMLWFTSMLGELLICSAQYKICLSWEMRTRFHVSHPGFPLAGHFILSTTVMTCKQGTEPNRIESNKSKIENWNMIFFGSNWIKFVFWSNRTKPNCNNSVRSDFEPNGPNVF